MVMRIEMCRLAADEGDEALQLSLDLRRESVIVHCVELDVETDRELRPRARIRNGFFDRRPQHHETRARDDAVLVRADHACIDRGRVPEVVGVDDEEAHDLGHERTTCARATSPISDRAGVPSRA